MSDLRELYQEMILDHTKSPRNYRKIEEATASARGNNPLCGDRVTIYVKIMDRAIKDVSFEGQGCAICTASASLMTQSLKGKTKEEAEALFEKFHHLVTDGEVDKAAGQGPPLGKLEVFQGVREYPIRVKCASLPWHTFRAALKQLESDITTE